MLIFRYLAKEVFVTLFSLTAILLLIFMSNQFVHYLNRAASGQFPLVFVLKLMILEVPNLLGLLFPLGFYMALMIAYGRLYVENEMTVLRACGYGTPALLRQSFMMAGGVALFVLLVMLFLSPHIAIERTKLLRTAGIQTLMQTIVPQQFRAVSSGREVFYVESMSDDKSVAHNVFLARLDAKGSVPKWDILSADTASVHKDSRTNEDYAILQHGHAYVGEPGHADYQVAEFETYKARLPHPFLVSKDDMRMAFTSTLWPMNNANSAKAAELQWRFSVPIMVLVLTLIGVPLSRVNPRSRKYARIFPAVLIYIVYANFMFIARDWIALKKLPIWLGMWWLHALFILLGLFLLWRERVKLS